MGADGKIILSAELQTDLQVVLQGHYTAGNGVAAAGGYVPINQVRIATTTTGLPATGLPKAELNGNTTYTIAAAGTMGIPTTAKAVFVSFTVTNHAAAAGALDAYSSDSTGVPFGYMFFPEVTQPTTLTAQVPLGADGKFKLRISGAGVTLDLSADVAGYWTEGGNGGSFTPAAGRLLNTTTRTPAHVAAHGTVKVQVEGASGIPPVGSGINAVAYQLTGIDTSSTGGYAIAWPTGQKMPAAIDLNRPGFGGDFVSE